MYPSDFNAAEAVYSPAGEGLVLGVPPLLALTLLLLVLAIACGAYMMGQKRAGQRSNPDADGVADGIHKTVLEASTAAMGASSSELRSKTEALRAVITALLGPVLAVGAGVNGPVAALDKALSGQITDPDKSPRDDAPGPGHGGGDKPTSSQPSASRSFTVNQFFGPPPPPAPAPKPSESHGADKPKPDAPPKPRPMTGPEQIEHLSRAIRQFHDHWSRRDDRIDELKAARAALNRPAKTSRQRYAFGPRSGENPNGP